MKTGCLADVFLASAGAGSGPWLLPTSSEIVTPLLHGKGRWQKTHPDPQNQSGYMVMSVTQSACICLLCDILMRLVYGNNSLLFTGTYVLSYLQ